MEDKKPENIENVGEKLTEMKEQISERGDVLDKLGKQTVNFGITDMVEAVNHAQATADSFEAIAHEQCQISPREL